MKKSKNIFNSVMREMEVYLETICRKYRGLNYSPIGISYTPNIQYQKLLDPNNPGPCPTQLDKQ